MNKFVSTTGFTSQFPAYELEEIPSVDFKTTGHFEVIQDKLYLVEHLTNKKYFYTNVYLRQDRFNDSGGKILFPKIWKNGKRGDTVLLSFLHGDHATPVVEGTVRMLSERHPDKLLRHDLTTFTDNDKVNDVIDNDLVRIEQLQSADGEIAINIKAKKNGRAKYKINCTGEDANGEYEISVNGTAKINQVDSDGNSKQYITLNPDNTEIRVDKILVHSKQEDLRGLLIDLIQAIQNITVATPTGTSFRGLINNLDFVKLRERIDNFMVKV